MMGDTTREEELEAEELLENGYNVPGWWALRSSCGSRHWVGHDEGVLCYKYYTAARIANLVIYEQQHREDHKAILHVIERYTGDANVQGSNILTFKTAAEAIADIEGRCP